MKHYVITVARGFGSGGKEIASKLAASLGIHCYENRILTLAAQRSGVDENLFLSRNERLEKDSKITKKLGGLPRLRRPQPQSTEFVSDETLFAHQKEIILSLAQTESCIIVGKCADWILKDFDNVMSVYIEAPRAFCAKRIMEKMGVDEGTAHRSISVTDAYRAQYYQHYTCGNYWTNPVNYDLTLNSARLGIDGCVSLLQASLQVKFPQLTTEDKVIAMPAERSV